MDYENPLREILIGVRKRSIDRLDNLSKHRGVSRSALIREAIEQLIQRELREKKEIVDG